MSKLRAYKCWVYIDEKTGEVVKSHTLKKTYIHHLRPTSGNVQSFGLQAKRNVRCVEATLIYEPGDGK